MSWLADIAGKAETFLNKIDQVKVLSIDIKNVLDIKDDFIQ